MKSQDQVTRMLAIVPYVQHDRTVTIDELAKTFDVTPKQILKDLEILYMCGLPGGFPDDLIEIDMDAARGTGVVRLSNADYLTRPLRFTRDEAMSLAVALRVVREFATGEQAETADRVLAKFGAAVGEQSGVPVELRLATGQARVRDALASAIDAGQRVRLTYDGAQRQETTHPLVDPVRMALHDGVAYLQAFSCDRGAWRTYRMERIVAVETTEDPATDHGEPPELIGDWLAGAKTVTLELSPEAAWVVEYYPYQELERQADGSVVAVFQVGDAGWLQTLLLRLGDQVRVLSDSDAGAQAAQAARLALAEYAALEEGSH